MVRIPIQHAVLALLTDGPSYGYELRASFQKAIGPQWGQLNIGHLYQVLDRLRKEGYVVASRYPQVDRPDRTVYQMTQAGRTELTDWLEQPTERATGYRDDFFLKLMAASRLGGPALRGVVRTYRQSQLNELRSLSELRQQHQDDPLVTLLIEAAALQAEAVLRLVDLAEERSPALVAAAARRAPSSAARIDMKQTGDRLA